VTEFDQDPLRLFGLAVSNGSQGFVRGLYVTTGREAVADTVLFIRPDGEPSVFATGLVSAAGLAFAPEGYGGGLLVAEIAPGRITSLNSHGGRALFADGFSDAVGPAQPVFGGDGLLYVTDFTGGTIARVSPSGSTETYAATGAWPEALAVTGQSPAGPELLVGLSNPIDEPCTGAIETVSAGGMEVVTLATGLQGLNLAATSPGGSFPDGVFVASEALYATDGTNDGGVLHVTPDGRVSTFMTGVDGGQVAFDSAGVFGGGMLVSDMDQWQAPDKVNRIWRVYPES
jgi:hypothetical protein